MSLKNVKTELKSKNLPVAFTPCGAPIGMVVVNADREQVPAIRQVMTANNYQWYDTFIGTNTDLQVCFKPVKVGV